MSHSLITFEGGGYSIHSPTPQGLQTPEGASRTDYESVAELRAAISIIPRAALPDVPSAYSALLLSAVFQRVDVLADSSIPIGKAYSKIGMNFAASAGLGWPAVVAPLNASIAELDAKLTTAGEGFTAGEKTWIEDWNATHNLGLTLPWG